jgi:glycosyltransferase involved in cell wall biosynthesis
MEKKISNSSQPLKVLSKGSLSGVNMERFNTSHIVASTNLLREKLGINKSDFVFSFIARKTRAKGAIDLLVAFSSISKTYENAKLLFIGPDEDKEICRLYIDEPKLFRNVIDIGEVSDRENYLAITDVLCLPSFVEGFGSIVIEAAAMCIPAIGSRIPGLIDSIEDMYSGMLFPVGDLGELVKCMAAFLENPEIKNRMGLNAKDRVEKYFTADILYEALKKQYMQSVYKNRKIMKRFGGLV